MWRNNKFLHNCQDFTILHICHVKKSEIPLHFSDFSPFAMYRNLKFLHMTDFSPHVSHVNFVTNMRYALDITLLGLWPRVGVNLLGLWPRVEAKCVFVTKIWTFCTAILYRSAQRPISGPKYMYFITPKPIPDIFLAPPTKIWWGNVKATSWRVRWCVWICIWCYFGRSAARSPEGNTLFTKYRNTAWKQQQIQKLGCTIANVVSRGFRGYKTLWSSVV